MPQLETQIQQSRDHSGGVLNLSEQKSLQGALKIFVRTKRFMFKCWNRKTKLFEFVAPTDLKNIKRLSNISNSITFIRLKSKLSKTFRKQNHEAKEVSFNHYCKKLFSSWVAD